MIPEAERRRTYPMLWAKLDGMAPYFKACHKVLEIGPNQGEFLILMKNLGIAARGVDLDPANVKACRGLGLDVVHDDGLKFLAKAGAGSFDGFFCSNVVEHLTVEKTSRLLDLACARLKPGGTLALMTGNSRCLAWVTDIIWHELSHVRPYPLELLSEMLLARGLEIVAAEEDERGRPQGPLRKLARLLKTKMIGPFFGPPEILVVARKPQGRKP
jgi:hypothetical protein